MKKQTYFQLLSIGILLILLFPGLAARAQSSRGTSAADNMKNSVSLTAGWVGEGVSASINYERLLSKKITRNLFLLRADLGGVLLPSFENAVVVGPRIVFLRGKTEAKLDLTLGLHLLYVYNNNEMLPLPVGSIGYRYHAKNEKFTFKIGVGLPDGLYLGGGIRF